MQGRLLAFKKVRKRPKCHLGGNKRPADFFHGRKIALTIDTETFPGVDASFSCPSVLM